MRLRNQYAMMAAVFIVAFVATFLAMRVGRLPDAPSCQETTARYEYDTAGRVVQAISRTAPCATPEPGLNR